MSVGEIILDVFIAGIILLIGTPCVLIIASKLFGRKRY